MMMVMIVRERRREIGILKAIGGSNTRIVLQFMVEAVTLTCIGAVIGLAIGVIAGNPVTSSLVDSSVGETSSPMMRPPSVISLDELRSVQAHISARLCNRSNIFLPVSVSRLPVGSSARMSNGWLARALAMAR